MRTLLRPYHLCTVRTLYTISLVSVTLMFSTACSVLGVESVEEAPYSTSLNDGAFELRDYDSFAVAETRVEADFENAGNLAFRKLFAYISGENTAGAKIKMTTPVIAAKPIKYLGEKIAMTAPVISELDGEYWVYRFVLPKMYTADTAPRPLNPDIAIVEVPPQRVAAVRYSGRATEKARIKNAKALLEWISGEKLTQLSEPRWAGYNPPWTLPALRRNEVLVDVATP